MQTVPLRSNEAFWFIQGLGTIDFFCFILPKKTWAYSDPKQDFLFSSFFVYLASKQTKKQTNNKMVFVWICWDHEMTLCQGNIILS